MKYSYLEAFSTRQIVSPHSIFWTHRIVGVALARDGTKSKCRMDPHAQLEQPGKLQARKVKLSPPG